METILKSIHEFKFTVRKTDTGMCISSIVIIYGEIKSASVNYFDKSKSTIVKTDSLILSLYLMYD